MYGVSLTKVIANIFFEGSIFEGAFLLVSQTSGSFFLSDCCFVNYLKWINFKNNVDKIIITHLNINSIKNKFDQLSAMIK